MRQVRKKESALTRCGDGRGALYPAKLPSFHRVPAPADLCELVRWFWIPRWTLAPGQVSRQSLLPFPASNLVVEPGGVTLVGPATAASYRELRGSGWAVGALLRPACIGSLRIDPGSIHDVEVPFDAPVLHYSVSAAMEKQPETTAIRSAVHAFRSWLLQEIAPIDKSGLLANSMEEAISTDHTIVRIDQVAERLGLSARQVQRLTQRYIGLTPLAVVRRYRLQEAAQRLREEPSVTIAQIAADLGYADQAHLSADFRRILGLPPSSYRQLSS